MTTIARSEVTQGLPKPNKRPVRRQKGGGIAALGVLIVVLAIGAYFGWDLVSGVVGGGGERATKYLTGVVQRGPLDVTVTEDGNVESASNVDIKCLVEGGSQILWIIPEGTLVEKGAELVKLNESAIREQVIQQQIAYEKARTTLIQAEEDLQVAEISIKEYEQGTFTQELQTADANIVVAKQNLQTSESILEHTQKMFAKGFKTEQQLESDKFALERAKLELDKAETARKVLVEFTKTKKLKELVAARDASKAKLQGEKAACELEKTKLDRLSQQLKNCLITAPDKGMVIYANEPMRGRMGGQGPQVEEGAQVREYQSIIKLPDLTQMQVKALVHETKVGRLRPGMQATIRVRSERGTGVVTQVASQPEPTQSWFSSVKEYATIVRISDRTGFTDLKPGMTAEVDIVVARHEDVLYVPLVGVVEIGGKHYSFLKTPNGYEKREVVIGDQNDSYIIIKDGLKEGEEIILNPRAEIPEARTTTERSRVDGINGNGEAKGGTNGASPGGPNGGAVPSGPIAGPVGPQAGPGGAAGFGPGGPGAAGKSGRRGGFDIMSFDENKDGKVTREEAQKGPEFLMNIFDRMDANKDGAVDAKEAAETRRRFEEKMKQGGGFPGGGFPGGGAPPGAAPSGGPNPKA